MKSLIFLFITSLSFNLFAHDRLTFLNNEQHLQICVVKQNGETVCGSANLNRLINSGKLVLLNKDDEKTKLFTADIKYILFDSIRLQILSLDAEIDEENSTYFLREMDTVGKVKLYEGYTTITKAGGGTPFSPGIPITNVYYSYALKTGKNKIRIIKEYKVIVFNVDVSNNYKKQLKKIFGKSPDVIKYLDSMTEIHFDDIPTIIKHINATY